VGFSGEGDGEGGAFAGAGGVGADLDAAVVLFHELFADPEAEAGADGAFGGEEGVEDVFCRDGGDAVAVVGYGDADAAFAVDGIERGGGAENDAALAADGVEAIGEQVGEDLAQLAGDAHDLEAVMTLLGDDGLVGADLCLEQIDDGIHQGAGGVAGGGGELAIEAEEGRGRCGRCRGCS